MPSRIPTIPPPVKGPAGCYKCDAKRCVTCKEHITITSTFTSVRTKHQYTIRDHLTCKTPNIIYLIDCRRCRDTQYVGETGKTLQDRFHHHRSDIRTHKDASVAKHFNSANHTLADLACTAIEQVRHHNKTARLERERYWRHKLKTNYPDGLNVWD